MTKRERSSNFSLQEMDLLLTLVERRKNIVECKVNDSHAWKRKDEAWEAITREMNSILGINRTVKCVRGKYDTMKKKVKHDLLKNKFDSFNEESASPSPPPTIAPLPPPIFCTPDKIYERVMLLAGIKTKGEVSRPTSNFDSENEETNSVEISLDQVPLQEPMQNEKSQDNVPVPVTDEDLEVLDVEVDGDGNWTSWNPVVVAAHSIQSAQDVSGNSSAFRSKTTQTEKRANQNGNIQQGQGSESSLSQSHIVLNKKRMGQLARKKLQLLELQINLAHEELEERRRDSELRRREREDELEGRKRLREEECRDRAFRRKMEERRFEEECRERQHKRDLEEEERLQKKREHEMRLKILQLKKSKLEFMMKM
ncbi:fibrinogen silencer-binding protein [Anabrus simplex]|uniref:fibrinogen silencer-binding protein n=1 Tax=Anabrus simplex TaxID=316456 RepID=UPI0035A291CB